MRSMKAFASLLDRLVYSPGRNTKLQLLQDYFRTTPGPDRGWALAALTDGLPFTFPVRRTVMELMDRRVDAELFRLSRDYVGDTAETVALIWPDTGEEADPPRLSEVISRLGLIDAQELGDVIASWLDRLDATGRWALLKLLTGALRVGVSARLAKTAVANMAARSVDEVEEVWHALSPPYEPLFAWLEGRAAKPDIADLPVFRPLMLAHALEERELADLDIGAYAVEWKWDGIRVQIAARHGEARLYSRTGDEIGASFPELIAMFRFDAVVDGELLVLRDGKVAPFNDLQQRLNRKSVTRAMLECFPAHVRLYDALTIDGEDLRPLPFMERRRRLERWHAEVRPLRTDLSEMVDVADRDALHRIWRETRGAGIEGLMLKRRASPYLAGRPRGHWYKWKRAPITVDCVLMYAQRGSGRRSSYYSDYTFGAWTRKPDGSAELVPVGKAYSGYTDAELLTLDRWIRNNTVERYGPVRAVRPALVLEIAFDAVQRSTRHRSGIAMRFPRIQRIRWDKPADEAEHLETLVGLIEG